MRHVTAGSNRPLVGYQEFEAVGSDWRAPLEIEERAFNGFGIEVEEAEKTSLSDELLLEIIHDMFVEYGQILGDVGMGSDPLNRRHVFKIEYAEQDAARRAIAEPGSQHSFEIGDEVLQLFVYWTWHTKDETWVLNDAANEAHQPTIIKPYDGPDLPLAPLPLLYPFSHLKALPRHSSAVLSPRVPPYELQSVEERGRRAAVHLPEIPAQFFTDGREWYGKHFRWRNIISGQDEPGTDGLVRKEYEVLMCAFNLADRPRSGQRFISSNHPIAFTSASSDSEPLSGIDRIHASMSPAILAALGIAEYNPERSARYIEADIEPHNVQRFGDQYRATHPGQEWQPLYAISYQGGDEDAQPSTTDFLHFAGSVQTVLPSPDRLIRFPVPLPSSNRR